MKYRNRSRKFLILRVYRIETFAIITIVFKIERLKLYRITDNISHGWTQYVLTRQVSRILIKYTITFNRWTDTYNNLPTIRTSNMCLRTDLKFVISKTIAYRWLKDVSGVTTEYYRRNYLICTLITYTFFYLNKIWVFWRRKWFMPYCLRYLARRCDYDSN